MRARSCGRWNVQFARLTGISFNYQYFMLREGEVLMRPHSCWCPACFEVAAAGPGAGTRLSTQYGVSGCAKAGNAIGAFPALAVNDDPEARQKWKLPREVEADALTWCR